MVKERTEPSSTLDALAHEIIGAAIEVHRQLGPGFLETVYEEAMSIELGLRGIPFERQKPVHVHYKGQLVGEGRVDLLVADALVLELKAVSAFAPVDKAKMIAYLKATGRQLGLILNFHCAVLKDGIQRVIRS